MGENVTFLCEFIEFGINKAHVAVLTLITSYGGVVDSLLDIVLIMPFDFSSMDI